MRKSKVFSAFAVAVLCGGFICTDIAKGSEVVVLSTEIATIFNGDTNGDLERDMSDAVYVLQFLFLGGPAPVNLVCPFGPSAVRNGDGNGDGAIDLSDGIRLLGWLFTGGAEPMPACSVPAGGEATTTTTASHIAVLPPPAFNVCNGDVVFLSGSATVVNHTTISDSGNFHTLLVIRWASLAGVGFPSGTQYNAVGGVTLSINNLGLGQAITILSSMRFISPGPEGNHAGVAHLHVTRNANGDLTAIISEVSFECRG